MPFSEIETAKIISQIEDIIWSKRRPPTHLRNQIREGQRIEGFRFELFLCRPLWNNPDEWIEEKIAKVRYVKSKNHWKLYWMRADLNWHAYPEKPVVKSLKAALKEIEADPFACFWG